MVFPRSFTGWRGWALPLAVIALAEAWLRLWPTRSDVFASPSAIARAMAAALADGSLLEATWQTLSASLGGLLIGGCLGLMVGCGFGLSRRIASRGALLVELLRPLPSVALIPVAMMVFGFGYQLELFVVAFAVFFPMLVLSRAAVGGVPARLLEVSRVLGLSVPARLFKIILPATLPRLFVGVRLCVGIALVVAVTTEIASNPQGLGYALVAAQQGLAPDLMLGVLIWVGLLGWSVNGGLLALEKRLFRNMQPGGIAA